MNYIVAVYLGYILKYQMLFFLICPTEAEFVISLLYIAAIFDFTKDLQELILQEWAASF